MPQALLIRRFARTFGGASGQGARSHCQAGLRPPWSTIHRQFWIAFRRFGPDRPAMLSNHADGRREPTLDALPLGTQAMPNAFPAPSPPLVAPATTGRTARHG